ncbi:MAG: biotin--[acetyl-CoA-carboxylase] ligase [Gammaproteobacteria bacterium]|nr:MAG: biotin--[acetyl-CoA-carboxylase] ligase [Gammaproteobacteria bacterium]RKZ41954.1 MAG: biotin--[acetyl-CoA-carboxylase] ligase [Gammaproteobacteria bacterium]RKZ74319.1 MAG: biotin--[acetyl-CoA-carboxylase] ligase [Gammaproteobacteria bacterium]
MYHQILQILADGCQYTTEQLIKQLTLSAIELEQAIKTLMAYGIRLHSPTANTYQLAEPVELLDRTTILSALPVVTRQRLKRLEIHSVLDSTNHYALTQYFDAVPYACLAEYQTAGRGRQGRQWISPYASGLCLSFKQHYATLDKPLSALNIALAVTVVRVLLMLGATDIGIKWPNDILWQGRKVAGLLLESRCGNGCDIVYGIGINVKLFDTKTINQPWIDLYTILEHSSISRNTLAAKLIDQCLQTLLIYPQVGLTAFRDDWYHFDLSYGQRVTLEIPLRLKKRDLNSIIKNKEYVKGTACGIDEQGALLLQVGHQTRRYVYGEVSLRL